MQHYFLAASAAVILAGCATQTPESQIQNNKDLVHICTEGQACALQHRSASIPAPAATEQEIQQAQRLEQLESLAHNSPEAAYDLGLRLLRGDGVQRDSFQALQWMEVAGEQGLTAAQFALGRLYLYGLEEMGADPATAEIWLTRAAANGHAQAKKLLPSAQKGKASAQEQYQAREQERKDWEQWMQSAPPYYWQWGHNGWQRY